MVLETDEHKFLLVQLRAGHVATQRYDRGSPLKTSVRCLFSYNYLNNNKKVKVHFGQQLHEVSLLLSLLQREKLERCCKVDFNNIPELR